MKCVKPCRETGAPLGVNRNALKALPKATTSREMTIIREGGGRSCNARQAGGTVLSISSKYLTSSSPVIYLPGVLSFNLTSAVDGEIFGLHNFFFLCFCRSVKAARRRITQCNG